MLFIHFGSFNALQGKMIEITGKAWWDLRESLERLGKLVHKVRENLMVTKNSSSFGKYGSISKQVTSKWIRLEYPTTNQIISFAFVLQDRELSRVIS